MSDEHPRTKVGVFYFPNTLVIQTEDSKRNPFDSYKMIFLHSPIMIL